MSRLISQNILLVVTLLLEYYINKSKSNFFVTKKQAKKVVQKQTRNFSLIKTFWCLAMRFFLKISNGTHCYSLKSPRVSIPFRKESAMEIVNENFRRTLTARNSFFIRFSSPWIEVPFPGNCRFIRWNQINWAVTIIRNKKLMSRITHPIARPWREKQ